MQVTAGNFGVPAASAHKGSWYGGTAGLPPASILIMAPIQILPFSLF